MLLVNACNLTIVICNCDCNPINIAELSSSRGLKQFNLEVFIFLRFHIIYYRDFNILLNLE